MRKKYLKIFICFLLLSSVFVIYFFSSGAFIGRNEKLSRRVDFLFGEMTVDPNRQQKALDELIKLGDAALIYFPCYFEDERPIATEDVKFLNTNPRAFEKYFLTGGKKIDDVAVQLFCARSGKCEVDLKRKKEIIEKLSKESIRCNGLRAARS